MAEIRFGYVDGSRDFAALVLGVARIDAAYKASQGLLAEAEALEARVRALEEKLGFTLPPPSSSFTSTES